MLCSASVCQCVAFEEDTQRSSWVGKRFVYDSIIVLLFLVAQRNIIFFLLRQGTVAKISILFWLLLAPLMHGSASVFIFHPAFCSLVVVLTQHLLHKTLVPGENATHSYLRQNIGAFAYQGTQTMLLGSRSIFLFKVFFLC